eukprot:Ihof_evm9s20 gene=Ihof_evmTU9s20
MTHAYLSLMALHVFLLYVYVDDMVIISNNEDVTQSLINSMKKWFATKEMSFP